MQIQRDNYWNNQVDQCLLMESSPPLIANSCGGGGSSVGDGGLGHIEHIVTEFDRLAGAATKYGVEGDAAVIAYEVVGDVSMIDTRANEAEQGITIESAGILCYFEMTDEALREKAMELGTLSMLSTHLGTLSPRLSSFLRLILHNISRWSMGT